MNKVAIVVQRCHESVVGGSEALAWQYAGLLRGTYQVEVLTTTALEYVHWANDLPPGREEREGILIHRFPVTIGRGPYWKQLAERMFQDYQPSADGSIRPAARPWSVAAEEEFIRHQGPHSEPLLRHLEAQGPEYRAIVFVTYLYATTYFGMAHVPAARALLVPTLHNEPVAYLGVFQVMARRARSVLWLTEAEERLGRQLWGKLPGRVVAMAVDPEPVAPARLGFPYLLYSGRIDAAKGCGDLVAFFLRYKEKHPSPLRLVLTGEDLLGQPGHAAIEYRGFVSPAEKFALMAGASAFVMPSGLESFSVATLEAMAQGTPVLVNEASPVLADHVRLSGAGYCYRDYPNFEAGLNKVLSPSAPRAELGVRARDYVVARYGKAQVRDRLLQEVEGGAVPLAARVSFAS